MNVDVDLDLVVVVKAVVVAVVSVDAVRVRKGSRSVYGPQHVCHTGSRRARSRALRAKISLAAAPEPAKDSS